MSAHPAHGQPPVTARAMRAAADLIETSGITGLSVTCDDEAISIQVAERAGDAATRAAVVARLATMLGGTAAQHDSLTGAASWIQAHGVAGALPVRVFTPIDVQTTRDGGSTAPLARTHTGRLATAPDRAALPAGWRWLTELDPPAEAAIPDGQVTS